MARPQVRFGLPPINSTGLRLAVALIAGSVIYGLSKSTLGPWLLLTPNIVWGRFALWQPLTYAFIETQPAGVLFGALILWQMGSSLEQTWGTRRVMLFAVGVVVLAGLLTTLGRPLWGGVPFAGGRVMAGAVWVAYGFSYGKRQTNFWGMPLSGNAFAGIGILFVVLSAVLEHWVMVVPDAFAIALTFAYVRYGSPSDAWLRFRGFLLQKKLKRRGKHLKVVGRDRNMGSGSDGFLH